MTNNVDSVDICFLPATTLSDLYRRRELSPVELVEAVLSRMDAVNPKLNAFVTVTAELARLQAEASERRFATGAPLSPLDGIPMGIKDLSPTKDIRTTYGSKIFEHNVPDADSPVVERLRNGGAIFLGKTNTPEFGWKSPTSNPLFGATKNPWDVTRTSAGSSGGTGAAIAAGICPIGTGGDGGGSIRQPASFCGVVGLKTTFGLIPMYPPSVVSTFASEGPMSRTVRDTAVAINVLAGLDQRDMFSAPSPNVDYLAACDGGIEGFRVAWSADLGYAAVDPVVRNITGRAAAMFNDLGCHVTAEDPGWSDPYMLFHILFYGLVGGDVRHNLPEWQDKMDPGLLRIVEAGRRFSAFDIADAETARNDLKQTAERFFERYDLLITPTMTLPPFSLGIDFPSEVGGTKVDGMQWTAFTFPFNLTGHPAISIPCGWTDDGLPIGLQIVGRRWEDASVLRAAAAFEALQPWSSRRPTL